jgi:hypothetical protein
MILEQPEVYTSLKTIPLNTIYTLGSREVLIRGFEYVKGKKLELFEWNYDFSVLTAYVRGTRRYKIKVFIKDDQIHCSCTCPAWVPAFPCKHVICVLLTTKSLLSPEVSSIPLSDEWYKASLLKSLSIESKEALNENSAVENELPYKKLVHKKKENRVEVVIDVRFSVPVLSLRKNGAKVFSPQDIPEELASSFYHTFSGYSTFYAISDLATYLARFGNTYPLVLETKKGNRLLRWEPELKVKTWTELDASGKKVAVKAGCLIDGAPCETFFRFSGFLADLGKNRLIKMEKEKGGWRLFDRLRDLFYGYEDHFDRGEELDSAVFLDGEQVSVFEAPNDHFKSAQILLEADFRKELSNHLILKVNGEVSPLLESAPDCRLSIHLHQGSPDQAQLKTETRMGQTAGATLTSLFRLFPLIETGKKFHPSLSAQKRKKVIYDIFFRLLQADKKSKIEKIIREGLLEGDFSRAETKKSAKQVLRYFHSIFKAEDERIWLNEGRWFVSRNDKAKEALLYQIPYELFGVDVFKGMAAHDKMSVPLSRLHENLSALYLKLKEHGIELYYNHKQVRSSSWEFSFDLTRSTGIDWFEIKPEIRCDGEEVKEKMWGDFLSRKGIVEREDSVQVVDSNAQAIMKSIFDISRTSGAGRGDKKEIVRMPRFQLLDWISLRKEGVIIKLLPEDERLIDRLTHFEKIEKTLLPDNLKATLRPYQKEGYDWLAFLYQHRLGGCLADDMGLGKTLQAISLLGGIKEGRIPSLFAAHAPHLVVVPTSLVFNWENEIAHFYPGLKVHVYTGKERSADFKDADLVITTYGFVRKDIALLKKISFHVIIFDEGQAIKNIYADTTGAVRQLKGGFKLVMTGTPLENHLGEYYSLIDLGLPGLLGDYDEFKPLIKAEDSPFLDRLLRRTRPFVLRRTKEKILKDLPPKIETNIYLDLTIKQRALYQLTVARTKAMIDEAYRIKTGPQAQIIALTALLRLRQICVSPRLVDPENREPSPKIEFLTGHLKQVLEEGYSTLVFSQFTSFLDILEEDLEKEGIAFSRLDGSTLAGKRRDLVQAFQGGEKPAVFLLSLKAGGQGLNLTRASYVFHLDPWWNPAVENQASDRVHRIGQKNQVTIMRILMRHTIEEKMMTLKKKKQALYEAVMGNSVQTGIGFSISRSDFDFLLAD